jgi:hypothetical protein
MMLPRQPNGQRGQRKGRKISGKICADQDIEKVTGVRRKSSEQGDIKYSIQEYALPQELAEKTPTGSCQLNGQCAAVRLRVVS